MVQTESDLVCPYCHAEFPELTASEQDPHGSGRPPSPHTSDKESGYDPYGFAKPPSRHTSDEAASDIDFDTAVHMSLRTLTKPKWKKAFLRRKPSQQVEYEFEQLPKSEIGTNYILEMTLPPGDEYAPVVCEVRTHRRCAGV